MGKSYRLTPNAVAVAAAKQAKRAALVGQLPTIDAANVKPNLSGPEQTALLRELGQAVERITRGTIGG
jgi:hypothetical protein